MLPSLLYREAPPGGELVLGNARGLTTDLDLDTVLDAMARGDPVLREASRKLLLCARAPSHGDIALRQEAVAEAASRPAPFGALYAALGAGLAEHDDAHRRTQPGYARFSPIVERIRAAAGLARILFAAAAEAGRLLAEGAFRCTALRRYTEMFEAFYDGDFLREARRQIARLEELSQGSRVTAGFRLGGGLKFSDFVVYRVEKGAKKSASKGAIRLESIAHQQKAMELRDAVLTKALGLISAVNARTLGDLRRLRFELAFLVGGANLRESLAAAGVPVCFPEISAQEEEALRFAGLADAGLALRDRQAPVGNALDLSGKRLCVVTGANQGGKSTFLRSVGCAALMARCGLFTAAERLCLSVPPRVFTHFCRPEDERMHSGKLDEELMRFGGIVGEARPRDLVLMNESFASTTESAGAAIAAEVTGALVRAGVRVLYVTHLHAYARALREGRNAKTALLRAERLEDGARTYIMQPGVSLPSGNGMDIFRQIMGPVL